MKGLDTNVLVRYLVQDNPNQSRAATHFIEQEETDGSLFVNAIVLCELVWVLESAYQYPKHDIIRVIEQILKTRQFHIHEADLLWQTLHSYQKETADFADHYIAHLNQAEGCTLTATFDKKAARLKHFTLLDNV
jgi:predicted nucleic-acid-binding protein